MDYFQTPHPQQANAGGAVTNQQQHQHQQAQHQPHQQNQQYHPYNGMNSQQNTQGGQPNNVYYQQQMYSQAQQSHNFTIQPASASAPLDHGSQHQHSSSNYHHNAGSHNNNVHHPQQQQHQHIKQQQHPHQQQQHHPQQHQQHQQQQQHSGAAQSNQQSHHSVAGVGTGAHMNYGQVHHQQQQRRGPMTSLMSAPTQGQGHHQTSQQQQSNQSQNQMHHHTAQHSQKQHQNQHMHNHQHSQQQSQHHAQQGQQQLHQQPQMGAANIGAHQQQHHHQHQPLHQQHANAQQIQNPPFFMPPGPPLGAVGLKELPVRIVIDSKYVGAVIGQGGAQIREITKESHAKVVVETQKAGPKDTQGNTEKVINISSSPENCTRAVTKILEVVQREMSKDEANSGAEVELKIRAHNQLVGRLIGKQGATIKKIMTETDTTILVSNEQQNRPDMQLPYSHHDFMNLVERTISVKGPSIENVAKAEARISAKLKKCFDIDSQHRLGALQNNMPGGNLMNPGLIQQMAASADPYGLMNAQRNAIGPPTLANYLKSVRLWVPDGMVGALIGTKGKNIKTIIRETGAIVKIETAEDKEKRDGESAENGSERKEERHELLEDSTADGASGDSPSADKSSDEQVEKKVSDERMVTVSGMDIQLIAAQHLIYQKISEQGSVEDPLKLRTEISVPSKIIGRIIGKGGQNVRELQRISGATVKIPEEEKIGTPEPVYKDKDEEDTTVVRIIGTIQSSQNVQFRLTQLVSDFHRMNVEKRDLNTVRAQNSPPTSK